MGEVNFGSGATPVASAAGINEQAPAQPSSAPAGPSVADTVGSNVPAVPRQVKLGDRIPTFDEIMVPFVNLVHPLSKELIQSFVPGSIVHDKKTLLYCPADVDKTTGNVKRAATAPVNIVVLGFGKTRYAEKVQGGVGGSLVDTLDQVRMLGGTTDYREWSAKKSAGMKMFDTLEEMLIAIERPEIVKDDGTVFTFPVEGKKYTIAKFGAKGAAYTEMVKSKLFTWRLMGCLAPETDEAGQVTNVGGYHTRVMALTTFFKPFKTGNASWVPTVSAGDKTTETFQKFVARVLGSF